MERVMREKQAMDKQKQDKLIGSVSQTLTTAVNTKLDKLVRNEMKTQVLPGMGTDTLYYMYTHTNTGICSCLSSKPVFICVSCSFTCSPAVNRTMGSLSEQVVSTMTQQLATTSADMQESINQMLQSRVSYMFVGCKSL